MQGTFKSTSIICSPPNNLWVDRICHHPTGIWPVKLCLQPKTFCWAANLCITQSSGHLLRDTPETLRSKNIDDRLIISSQIFSCSAFPPPHFCSLPFSACSMCWEADVHRMRLLGLHVGLAHGRPWQKIEEWKGWEVWAFTPLCSVKFGLYLFLTTGSSMAPRTHSLSLVILFLSLSL